MQQKLVQSIVEEIRSEAAGNFLGKIFQLTPLSFAIDMGVRGRFLFISAEPSSPRLYLIRRRVRDLEKQSIQLSHFGQLVKALLGGGQLLSCEKDAGERIVRLTFRVEDDLGVVHFRRLVAQLTGRASNLFVLDELNRIIAALRPPRGTGQNPGEYYRSPPTQETGIRDKPIIIRDSPSDAADEIFAALDATKEFDLRVSNTRARLRTTKNQKIKLQTNLLKDLAHHGNPEEHKKIGNLLLANVATALRKGNKIEITDFYSDDAPTIEVEVDQDKSLQDAATESFRRYGKAKRAQEEISERLRFLDSELSLLDQREKQLDRIARERDATALAEFDQPKEVQLRAGNKAKRGAQQITGVRRYLSTDGYEILVGRASKDNDYLTFRIARPNDLWLHAGDYPGSHVVVRNPTRKEVPQRTIIEAAQLAGKFSQAGDDAKVVVRYTERKFLSKPKGAAPGLVRISSFRSITVEPKESVRRI